MRTSTYLDREVNKVKIGSSDQKYMVNLEKMNNNIKADQSCNKICYFKIKFVMPESKGEIHND